MSYHLPSGSALKQCKWNQQKIEYLAYIIFESPTTRNDFFRLDICIYMVEPNERYREREKERGSSCHNMEVVDVANYITIFLTFYI